MFPPKVSLQKGLAAGIGAGIVWAHFKHADKFRDPITFSKSGGGMVNSKSVISSLFLFLLCVSLAFGQLDTGNIFGTVADQTGAAVPGAGVSIKNIETGIVRRLVTNEAGRYEAVALPVGTYEVTASLAGFKTFVRGGIGLTVGRNAVVDIALQVGDVTDAITITAETSQVETTTATVTQLIDERKVLDIPLNNRDLTQLAYFDAFVMRTPTGGGGGRNASGGLGDHLSVAGMRGSNNMYLLDGVNNGDFSNNTQSATTGYVAADGARPNGIAGPKSLRSATARALQWRGIRRRHNADQGGP